MNKLHIDLLLGLRAAAQFGLGLDDLLTDMRRGRHAEVSKPELEQALRDLVDRSFADAFKSPLGGKRWRILALGESALREERL